MDCDKYDELCTRFGVTGDGEPLLWSLPLLWPLPTAAAPPRACPSSCTRWRPRSRSPLVADADATGTPQLLWFRNGTFVGAYEGELDATAIKAWAAQKGSAEAAAGAE